MVDPNTGLLPDAIFDALPARLAVVRAKGRIVRVNAAWLKSTRPLPGPGAGVADVYIFVKHPAEEVDLLLAGVRRVLAGHEAVYRQELEHDDAACAGGRGWTGVTIVPLGEGEHSSVLVELSDVTERKLAQKNEAALRESKARFRSLADMSSDWYWQQDAQFRFVFFSGDDTVLDLPYRDDTIGKTPWELTDRLPVESTWADHQALLLAHLPFKNFEYVFRPEGQPPTYISVSGHPVFAADGVFTGYRGTASDITAAKTAQLEIIALNAQLEERVSHRTLQLEQANSELQAFAYSVAHDLRGPLISINGFTHLIERSPGNAPQDIARRAHAVGRIRTVVQQMDELTSGLLALAQISRTGLHWMQLDLGELATHVHERQAEREPGRVVEFVTQAGLLATCDRVLMTQLLDNLIGNARKFTAGNPKARITLMLEVDVKGEECFVLQDNGVGFDAAAAPRLFSAFQRFHKAEEFPGTGIGLATVHRIITRHGGRIWARSQPGEGAAFCFSLGMPPAP